MSYQTELLLDSIAAGFKVSTEQTASYRATAGSILAGLFLQQRNVVLDPARRKAALCPRRAGKSWTAMSYAFWTCLRTSGARVVLCTLTLKHARNVYWADMKSFARAYGLAPTFHLHDMQVTFANGSTIMMLGAESIEEIEKLRGGKYDLVIVDECKSFNPRILEELIEDVIWPALGDRKGSLLLIGTPGNVLQGPFCWATLPGYEIVLGSGLKRPFSRGFYQPETYWTEHPKNKLYWSRHSWTRADNITLPHLVQEGLDAMELNGWAPDHPTYRREYLAEWVAAVGVHVYAYNELHRTAPDKVTWRPGPDAPNHGLPPGHDWRFIMGLDLGFEDDFAIVVCAYSMTDGTLYHVFDWKENHQDIFHIADKIQQAYARFDGFDAMVGDWGGSGKLVLETLNKRWGWLIQPAEKREKFDHIELLNGDFIAGKLRVLERSNLHIELCTLQWLLDDGDDKALLARQGKLKENPSQPNHLCDAFLYVWRFSHHYWAQAPVRGPALGSPEFHQLQATAAMERLGRAQAERSRAGMFDEILANSSDPLEGIYGLN